MQKSYDKLRVGNEELQKKLFRPIHLFPSAFMVATGLSSKGVGKIIFCVGTMNSYSYKQTLDHFKEDVGRLMKIYCLSKTMQEVTPSLHQ